MSQPPLTFQRYGAEEARAARDTVETIYRGAYTEAIEHEDRFNTPDVFMRRFDTYTRNRAFDLVIAYADGKPAGQTWGWPLAPGSRWWSGLDAEPEPGFTSEDGNRTFALSEIMVRQEWTGRGVAHALHDELLGARHEKRATLLVEAENKTAYRAYTAWGWRKVARLRPGWPDAPLFDVLILPLPLP
jgi:GNAT superfamily N-acetyltransferase